jgi:hypothetical protein
LLDDRFVGRFYVLRRYVCALGGRLYALGGTTHTRQRLGFGDLLSIIHMSSFNLRRHPHHKLLVLSSSFFHLVDLPSPPPPAKFPPDPLIQLQTSSYILLPRHTFRTQPS